MSPEFFTPGAAANSPAPKSPDRARLLAVSGYPAVLILMAAAALWMRTANLMDVQAFNGDQGRDYLVVMNWLQRGQWPLLGPDRAAVGDHALGPGWFYTVAPAMALSGFHPAAGAATVALASVLAFLLIAEWVRRATGSRAAALVTGGVFAFSAAWTEQGRTLWNPNILPLGVAALAWLLQILPRRPASCLAAILALCAILPHWHTTGLLIDAAVIIPLCGSVAGCRRMRHEPRRSWILYGAALLVFLAFLYIPPLIYELRPGRGNVISYFTRAAFPAQPFPGGWLRRAWMAFDRLIAVTGHQTFPLTDQLAFLFDPANPSPPALALRTAAGLAGLVLLIVISKDVGNRSEHSAFRTPHSALFLTLLAGGFWLVLLIKGAAVQDYYLIAPEIALLMLGGWTAGRLLTSGASAPSAPPPKPRLRWKFMAGTALLLGAGALSLAQFPRAWAVHQGMTPHRFTFRVTREVCEAIARDAGARPFSLELAEPYNFSAHYIYLLRWMGRPPQNEDYYAHAIPKAHMGERIYIVQAPGLSDEPALKGIAPPYADFLQVRNVTIWKIDPAHLAPAARELRVIAAGPQWSLEAL